MKILIFNWRDIENPKAGGAEVFTHENAKRWVEAGNEVTLFTSAFPNCKKEEIIDGVKIIRAGGKYTVYWHAFRYYKRRFKGKFDLIIDEINTIPFFTPFYVQEQKVTVIYQMTGDVYFRVFPKPLAFLAYNIEPTLFKIYKKISTIVLSESVKEELINIGFSPSNITVASPGIDHKNFEIGEKTIFPSILYLNRVVRYKNVDDLIKAFKLAKEKVPTAKLLIAGCRGGGYELKLRKLVKKLNLKDVEFYPFVVGDQKKKLLQSSWVHVLPSTKEGWGISVIEAAASGTPTVGYHVHGLRDSVKNGETGLLVPYRDIKSLAKEIEKLLIDDELRKRLSKNCVKWSKRFTWNMTAQQSLQVIEKIGDVR